MQAPDGPILIFAGAGSGKTRVLTHRIAYLLQERHIAPTAVLAVTFTNKAAEELKSRLRNLVGNATNELTVGTFHAICARFLRREGPHVGLDRAFTIYDDDDQLGVVRAALKNLDIDEKHFSARPVLSAISRLKNRMVAPLTIPSRAESYWDEVVHRVYARYEEMLRHNSAVDFDDLLLYTAELFRTRADILALYQQRYQHILVDEFQDTNAPQYELVKLLGSSHGNVLVVGDDDQSIYGFRGASVANILSFERDFPGAHTYKLEQNYRSTEHILAAAQAVVEHNEVRAAKRLWTALSGGERVHIVEAGNEQDEGQFIIREIRKLQEAGVAKPGDCAVLYRTNAQSRAIEEVFINSSMEYRLIGGTRFYDRKEVKDVLAYFRLASNGLDDAALKRVVNVPPRGIGAKTVADLVRESERSQVPLRQVLSRAASVNSLSPAAKRACTDLDVLLNTLSDAARTYPVADLFTLILERTGMGAYLNDGSEEGTERYNNVQELLSIAQSSGDALPPEGLELFLDQASLASSSDATAKTADATTLITLHAAKGLEFPVVFMAGMEEDLFPHSRSADNPAELEEERRLCYVGMTRAMRRLYLIHTTQRTIYGSARVNEPSRFLTEIPRSGVVHQHSLSSARGAIRGVQRWATPQHAMHSERQTSPAPQSRANVNPPPRPAVPVAVTAQYAAGDRVHHKIFGNGVVVKSTLRNDLEEIEVNFETFPIKKLITAYAPLVRL